MKSEVDLICERYDRRGVIPDDRYSLLKPENYLPWQERNLAIQTILWQKGFHSAVKETRILEIGCGTGRNLLLFLSLGFLPRNIVGNELLPDRVATAVSVLPKDLRILAGDALQLSDSSEGFDIVFQSMVFSSILDNSFRKALAKKMWEMVKPGGGVLWYDFVYNNPWNQDVRGAPAREVRSLFPEASIEVVKVTLLPMLCRYVTRIHPVLYKVFNLIPFLRSHILCWVEKKSEHCGL